LKKSRAIFITVGFYCLIAGTLFGQKSFNIDPVSLTQNLDNQFRIITMPALDVDALLEEDKKSPPGTPYRYGYSFEVDYSMDNSGTWTELEEGKLWRLAIKSEGAYSISLYYDTFWLPKGAYLFAYNSSKSTIYGAYTNENNDETGLFSTAQVEGDECIIEYYEPNNVKERGHFIINKVIHDYKDILNFSGTRESLTCGINVACSDADPFADQSNSVAWLDMGGYICTGGMVNNVREDKTPYFLTAWHCTEGESPSIFRFYFNYQTNTCSGTNASYGSYAYGSQMRANSGGMDPDFSLLEITGNIYDSWDVFYAGWTRSTSTPVASCSVHHPGGDPKKINFDNDYCQNSPGINWYGGGYSPPGSHWGIYWDEGGVEGGSSGSPAFDSNGRVIGQLSGGSASCGGDYDYYGKFSRSWNYGSSTSTRLKDWLDPDNTGTYTLDGIYDEPATVVVSAPNGGEEWELGSTYTIMWNSENTGSYVKIELYDNNSYYTTIATSTSDDGSYSWSVSSSYDESNTYKIKITDTGNSSTYDYSDNYFSLTGTSMTINIAYSDGWNMVGLPVNVEDAFYLTLFPDAFNGTLYSYNNGYIQQSVLTAGDGYWLRFTADGISGITGTSIEDLTLSLSAGWNLISGVSVSVPLSSVSDLGNIIVPNTLYSYDNGYSISYYIEPGNGYWLRAYNAGSISISSGSARQYFNDQEFSLSDANILTIMDDDGNSSELYFGSTIPEEVRLSYSLPPIPPSGSFDARFSGDWKLAESGGEILLQSNHWPLTVEWELETRIQKPETRDWVLVDEINGEEYILNEDKKVKITQITQRLRLAKRTLNPDLFVLHQNYPNPFNPITTISFNLPELSNVKLTVYNTLGQEIERLVNTQLNSGIHLVNWDASALSSGIYFYGIEIEPSDESEAFTSMKKMLLIK